MGKHYEQISIEERCEMARLRASGRSIRQIASTLGRAPSTIARELKRNGNHAGVYTPSHAHNLARARRWTGSRLTRDVPLRTLIVDALKVGLSPEQLCGRLKREHGRTIISYESIYRFIYAEIARTKDYSWRHLLPWAKSKRGWRGRRGGSAATFIRNRSPLSERPSSVNDRREVGHWEADTMLFTNRKQVVLTLHERQSRILIAMRPSSKAAAPTVAAMADVFAALPPPLRQTVTFDNGTEFARHYDLHDLGIQTFFCDTHSPWQKGGVENAIGRMRRTLPRKADLAHLSEQDFADLVLAYNNTPRKCLDYQTPAEVFSEQLLHFKRELAFPPSRE